MAPPTIDQEYAELMRQHRKGQHLYTPAEDSKFRPGLVGYFNFTGDWVTITDLLRPEELKASGFSPFNGKLDEPGNPFTEKMRTSGSDAEQSFGLSAGISGALSAAPIDLSVHAKNSNTRTGQAALVTEFPITPEAMAGPWATQVQNWLSQNKKAMLGSDYGPEIRKSKLLAIGKTWTTPECAIIMSSSYGRETGGGGKVAGTGLAELGVDASWAHKLNAKGWTMHKARGPNQKLVIAYAGLSYTYRKIPFKTFTTVCSVDSLAPKQIVTGAGERVGTKYFWPVVGVDGALSAKWIEVLDQKPDSSEPAPVEEKEEEEEEEEEDEEESFVEDDVVGMSKAELKEQEMMALREEKKHQELLVSTFIARILSVEQDKDLETEDKRKQMQDLLDTHKDVEGAWKKLARELSVRQQEREE